MRRALVISLLALVVLVGSSAAALQRYDASRSGLIVEGTTIGGVNVGGISEEEALVAVRRELGARLKQPVTLTYRDRRFELDPALVEVTTNADELVRTAVAESGEGNFLQRSFRDLTGSADGTGYELDVG